MSADLSERRVVIAGMGVISSSGKDLVTLQTDDADVVAAGGRRRWRGWCMSGSAGCGR
jgi:hypothetical protein